MIDYLRQVRAESDTFLDAALDGDMDVAVSSCPGWAMTDLVGHLGVVQRFHGTHILRGVTEAPPGPRPDPPQDGLAEWFRDGTDLLLDNLTTVGSVTPAWNWSIRPQDRVTSFWHRRMALEAAIHRWDAQSARGRADGFDTDLAVDGVDEVLAMWVPSKRRGDEPQGTATIHLTDVEQSMTVVNGDPEAAQATIAGPAGDVWLALWGRVPLTGVDVSGDHDLAASIKTG